MPLIDVGMFERMMRRAEVTEIVDACSSATSVVVIVVDLAAVHRHPASKESAVLISRSKEAPHLLGGGVGVGLCHQAGRVEEQA